MSWEYEVIDIPSVGLQDVLNAKGDNGWEFVAIADDKLIFRRSKAKWSSGW